jgi:hypothetical protein
VCLVDHSYNVWLCLDQNKQTALGLEAKRSGHFIRKHGSNGYRSKMGFEIQRNAWYELKIRVEATQTRFFINGYELKPVNSRPPSVSQVVLVAENARAAFRNWKITPLE